MQLAGKTDDMAHDVPPAGREGDQHRWHIDCRDVVDRERSLTLLIDRDRVVLVGPPGETAVLSPVQVRQLSVALGEAAHQAGG